VAERLVIGVEAVSRIERGVVLPTVVRLAELADIYECNIADLITETSSRTSDQARLITRQLDRLDLDDRNLILEIIERLADRLGQRTG
jgi:transcriptional regulator with XRE-family HTH domain